MSTSRLPGLLGLLALALIPLVGASPASATSYVPVSDEALVDQAPVIAVVEVQGSAPGEDGSRPFTGHRVRVEKVLKGAMATGLVLTVRVPGGVRADGLALRIWGAPQFKAGERALLFLSPRLDGTYSIVHLMLGAFHEIRAGGHRLAVRHLAETRAVARPGETVSAEPLRDFDRFVRWIAGRARGLRVRADYQVAVKPGLARSPTSSRSSLAATVTTCAGSSSTRTRACRGTPTRAASRAWPEAASRNS